MNAYCNIFCFRVYALNTLNAGQITPAFLIVGAPAQSLSLAVEFCTSEICSVIIRVELPNSSVYPDFVYTAKYTIVGNDLPVVQYGSIRSYLFNKGTGLAEICVEWNFSL